MNWISGCDRKQRHFLPACIEDYVSENNPVRLVDAFVNGLDLRALGFVFPKENPQGRGRPGYPPTCLLKLYLYGYLYQIRSSRRLEAECGRNLEVIWLVEQRSPDFKTIADFRKDNAAAFKAVARQFNRVCRSLDLFGDELAVLDGTKVKGQNAPELNWSVSKLEKQLARLEKRLGEYLQALDQADRQAPAVPAVLDAAQLREKIAQIQAHKQEAETKLQTLEQAGQTQLSATDPDSRSMKGRQGHVVGYNVQGVADGKHHLLVVTEVVNSAADQTQLQPMMQAIQAEAPVLPKALTADGGYYAAEGIKYCEDQGVPAHLPEVKNSPSERAGLFGKADFHYQSETDTYLCPAGKVLGKERDALDKGRRLAHYNHPPACEHCPLKVRCTKAKYRTVSRWEHEEVLERMRVRVVAEPEKLAQRKTIIEHCWGTLKWLLPGGFLLKGLTKVKAEVSLAHWAYNFKRALKVAGLPGLLAALQSVGQGAAS